MPAAPAGVKCPHDIEGMHLRRAGGPALHVLSDRAAFLPRHRAGNLRGLARSSFPQRRRCRSICMCRSAPSFAAIAAATPRSCAAASRSKPTRTCWRARSISSPREPRSKRSAPSIGAAARPRCSARIFSIALTDRLAASVQLRAPPNTPSNSIRAISTGAGRRRSPRSA